VSTQGCDYSSCVVWRGFLRNVLSDTCRTTDVVTLQAASMPGFFFFIVSESRRMTERSFLENNFF